MKTDCSVKILKCCAQVIFVFVCFDSYCNKNDQNLIENYFEFKIWKKNLIVMLKTNSESIWNITIVIEKIEFKKKNMDNADQTDTTGTANKASKSVNTSTKI